MPKFNVEVTETLARLITVEAPTPDQAEEKIRAMYEQSEIVLNSNDMVGEEDIQVLDDAVPDDFPVDVVVGTLSPIQEQTLKKPCPNCGGKLQEVGDLSDFDHDIVTCTNDKTCDYTMFYDGSNL